MTVRSSIPPCSHAASASATTRSLFAALACFVLAGPASANFITFETRPDGTTPLDDEVIPLGTGYTTNDGVTVTFGFDTNNDNVADLAAAFEDTLEEAPSVSTESGGEGLLSARLQQLQPHERGHRAGTFDGASRWPGDDRAGDAA